MRKTFQPTTRKVYAGSPQSNVVSSIGGQTTTVRRVGANSLLSPDQNSPRILKHSTIATTPSRVVTQQQQHSAGSANSSSNSPMKCYICDCFVGGQGQLLMETSTNTTQTKLPNKIGRVIGDSFLVIVRADDIVCRRCVGLFNQFDQLETQLETVKNQLMGFITKKYAIDGTDDSSLGAPAAKLQKMNSGAGVDTTPSSLKPVPSQPNTVVRKVVAQTLPVSPGSRKAPVKIYKCMSCDFTTSDLKQFTPHYNVCPGVSADNNGSSAAATNHQTTATTTVANSVQTQQTASPAVNKVVQRRPLTQSLQKAEAAASAVSSPAQHSCSQCPFKTASRQVYEEHMRRHQVKVKPFKCRICSARFEDRETASKHARAHSTEYYKCGTCSVAYRDRNQLIKHFEVHRNDGTGGQQIIIKASSTNVAKQQLGGKTGPAIVGQPQLASTQRLLQETIDEACNEAAVDTKNIHFFSCAICSLTFIQENYYTAHMETHKEQSEVTATKKTASSPATGKQQVGRKTANGQSLIKGENDDLESIFEKMHSEKGGGQQGNDVSSTGIDMPALDQGDDEGNASQEASVPVSMPSLDDDENAAAEQAAAQEAAGNAEGGVPMEIDDMQNSADGGEQLKFVLSENGQLLQLDNHILTDAEGNQLIVQGGDPEHLQQLLQSVGLEGSTLQMIQGENNQMILVQQDGEQAQLIDASMLNVDGQIVLQQAQGGDGEMSQDGVEPEGEEGHHQQQGEEGEAQQVQFDASDVAHQEAAAVLAAAADQHVLLQAAVAEAASGVDENSQEDLGGAGGEGATAEGDAHHEETSQDEVSASQAETQQMAEGEEQQHGEEENSQEAVAAGSEEEHQQQQQQEAVSQEGEGLEGGEEASSSEQVVGESENKQAGEEEEGTGDQQLGGGGEEKEDVTTTNAEEKISSTTTPETEATVTASEAEDQKEDFGFF